MARAIHKQGVSKDDPNRRLTPYEEKFAQAMVRHGMNRNSAMLEATPASANWKEQNRRKRGWELATRPAIVRRIDEISAPVLMQAQFSLESHLNDLKTLRDSAAEVGDFQAAVKAEELRGKASGIYIERHEVLEAHYVVLATQPAADYETWRQLAQKELSSRNSA